MTIAFVCPNNHQLSAPDDMAGKAGKCPKCGSKFLIPSLEELQAAETAASPGTPAPSPAPVHQERPAANRPKPAPALGNVFVFLCPNGHKLNGPPSLKGKAGQCPHCGARFRIPSDEDEQLENEEVVTGEVIEDAEAVEDVEFAPEEPQISQAPLRPVILTTWQLPPPEPMGGHRLAELFTWMWLQREPKSILELVLKDGQTLSVKMFAPELSQLGYGVFALQDETGKFTITTLPWENVAKMVMRNLEQIPHALFE